jgi:predicted dehydrogenase
MKAALIGCGRISGKHVEAYGRLAGRVELVAACDLDIEKARKVSPKAYRDYRRMLDTEKPDFVSVATDSGSHAAVSIECLQRGIHVICEKPMALSTADCDAMIAAADASGAKLAVCFQNRFNPPIARLAEAVRSDRFGRILHGSIQVRWNRGPAYYEEASWRGTWERDGGTLMNQCTHGIDLLQWAMGGDVRRVQAVTRRFLRPIEAEDYGAALLEFGNGAIGVIEGSACVYPKNLDETLSIFGEKGTAVIGGLAVNRTLVWDFLADEDSRRPEGPKAPNSEADPPTVYGFGHIPLFEDFLDSIRDGREPAVSGSAGRKAVEIVLAIYLSQKRGAPVDLPVDFATKDMRSGDLEPRFGAAR